MNLIPKTKSGKETLGFLLTVVSMPVVLTALVLSIVGCVDTNYTMLLLDQWRKEQCLRKNKWNKLG